MLERFVPIFHAADPDNKHHIDHLLAFIQENDATLAQHGAPLLLLQARFGHIHSPF